MPWTYQSFAPANEHIRILGVRARVMMQAPSCKRGCACACARASGALVSHDGITGVPCHARLWCMCVHWGGHPLPRHALHALRAGDARYRGVRAKRGREHYLCLQEMEGRSEGKKPHVTHADGGEDSITAHKAAVGAEGEGQVVLGAAGVGAHQGGEPAEIGATPSAAPPPATAAAAPLVGAAAQPLSSPVQGAGAKLAQSGVCVGSDTETAAAAAAAGPGQVAPDLEQQAPSLGPQLRFGHSSRKEGVGAVEAEQEGLAQAEDGEEGGEEDEEEEEGEGLTLLADGTHLCLCAAELQFKHPITGQLMHFSLPEPEYFEVARQAAMH